LKCRSIFEKLSLCLEGLPIYAASDAAALPNASLVRVKAETSRCSLRETARKPASIAGEAELLPCKLASAELLALTRASVQHVNSRLLLKHLTDKRWGRARQETRMLWTVFAILLLLWLLDWGFHIAGSLIHLILVIALVVLLIEVITGRRAAV
jgi:hypothetical protein